METRLGMVEARFADIVWEHAPLTTRQLVNICAEELNWARTTTYTVLTKFCNRGIFHMNKRQVTVLIPKEKFRTMQTEQFVQENFQGSLPAFIAAFTARKTPTQEELAEIRKMIEAYGEKNL